MTKEVIIPCIINGQVSPTVFKIGNPAEGSSPIQFQSKWLGSAKQGSVPPHILKALEDLQKVSLQTGVSIEELCDMVFNKKGENNEENK